MERTTLPLIREFEDNFYVSYMKREQFNKIPSTEGVKFYDAEPYENPVYDYTVFYARSKLLNYAKDFDEEEGCYYLKEVPGIYPDFFVKNLNLEE